MSSSYVRTQVKAFITSNIPSEDVIDLTGEFDNIKDLLAKNSINPNDPWTALQFIGNSELAITVPATNTDGKYREFGVVIIHIVERSKATAVASCLTRAEAFRDAFRGQRINDILIKEVSPPNFDQGATLNFEGGYTSAAVIVTYERDLDL